MGFLTAAVIGMTAASAVQAEQARKSASKAAKKQQEELARLEAGQEKIGPPVVEDKTAIAKRHARRSSRSKTVVTGDLTPAGVGEKTLLG